MSKEAVFTMKLEPELRDSFMAEAEASHRPASQIVRELMREFVERQRQAREYETFLHAKVADARKRIRAGDYASAEEVETRLRARRAQRVARSSGTGRPAPALAQLSSAAKAAREPLPPEDLVDAQHDRVHRDLGRGRIARTVRNKRRGTS